jgi:hypothetical protein
MLCSDGVFEATNPVRRTGLGRSGEIWFAGSAPVPPKHLALNWRRRSKPFAATESI